MDFTTYGLKEAREYDAGNTASITGTQFEERLAPVNRFVEAEGLGRKIYFRVEAFIPGCLNDYDEVYESLTDAIEDRNNVASEWYGEDTHVELRFPEYEEDWTGDLVAKRYEDSYGGYAISVSPHILEEEEDCEDTVELVNA